MNAPDQPLIPPPESVQFQLAAASHWGIEPEYWDIWGQHHTPDPQVIQAVLRSLGVRCESPQDLAQATEELAWREWSRAVPATLVLLETDRSIPIRVPQSLHAASLRCHITLESGEFREQTIALTECTVLARSIVQEVPFVEVDAPLADALPPGYHRLRVEVGRSMAECRLIIAPERAWAPHRLQAGGKTAGVAVSLYGVRSERNWGCGDFTDLEGLLLWLKEDLHGSFLALNPLHAIDNRQPYNISPYLPNSAYFRNPLYIDVERVPEFAHSRAAARCVFAAGFQETLGELRQAPFVEYEKVWYAKRFFLALLYREFLRSFDSARKAAFDRYTSQQGERLDRFALYCALWDRLHRHDRNLWIWQEWPEQYRDPDSGVVKKFREDHQRQIGFHKYVQWVLDEQLAAVQQKARDIGLPIGLYHDLALATDKCGADVWAYRPFYVTGCRVGSPPDGFAPEGQDWAFPPPHALRHKEDGYRLFIDSIRANSRHGGALRIDHVMRLFRLYWIPDGMEAKQGVYVRDFHEDLLRILALESHRGKFFIVGEDLGTVTDVVRDSLERYGVLSYKVFFFEKLPDGRFRPPDEYSRRALVSSTTHDLPTLAGFWTGRDIEARMAAGLLPDPASYQRQWSERARDKQMMLDVLAALELLPAWFPRDAATVPELSGELHNAIIGFLTQTPSMVMVLNQEDLTKETEQQNLPASTWQYPNWRRKMKYSVEELRAEKAPLDYALMFRNWLKKSGRAL